jgi:hypothetical protein
MRLLQTAIVAAPLFLCGCLRRLPATQAGADRKLDSSLVILVRSFRAGGDAAAESAAHEQLIPWSGALVRVQVTAKSGGQVPAIEGILRSDQAESVSHFENTVYGNAKLSTIDRLSRSPLVWSIGLPAQAR